MDAELLKRAFEEMRDTIKSDEFAAKLAPSRGLPSLEVRTSHKPNTTSQLILAIDVAQDSKGKPTNQWQVIIYDPDLARSLLGVIEDYARKYDTQLN